MKFIWRICLTHYWNKKITAKEIFTMKEIIEYKTDSEFWNLVQSNN